MNTDTPLDKAALAQLIAADIPVGAYVNLGIGLPTTISNYLEPERHVTLQTENGMLGMGPEAKGDQIDPDLINAGKIPVTELPGAAYFHHADSFAMMRGGHLDMCVMGAYQVSRTGDLANWSTGAPDSIPAVGGAMDLAIGAKQVLVMMMKTFVQSLARGLAVLRAFDDEHRRMSLSEVAQLTGTSRATARRSLLTLVELGYMATDGRVFWLTPQVLALGYAYIASSTLPELATPLLRELTELVQESASLSVLDGESIRYVGRVGVRQIMRTSISVGTSFPAYATSMGRVLLAGLSDEDLETYLATSKRPKLTPLTVVDTDELRAAILRTRELGWASLTDELEPGLCSMAAPVTSSAGRVIAAINVSLASGVGSAERLASYRPHVLATASAISSLVTVMAANNPAFQVRL